MSMQTFPFRNLRKHGLYNAILFQDTHEKARLRFKLLPKLMCINAVLACRFVCSQNYFFVILSNRHSPCDHIEHTFTIYDRNDKNPYRSPVFSFRLQKGNHRPCLAMSDTFCFVQDSNDIQVFSLYPPFQVNLQMIPFQGFSDVRTMFYDAGTLKLQSARVRDSASFIHVEL